MWWNAIAVRWPTVFTLSSTPRKSYGSPEEVVAVRYLPRRPCGGLASTCGCRSGREDVVRSPWRQHSLSSSLITRFMGPTWDPPGPTGTSWAPCWPHGPCYLGWSLWSPYGIWFVDSCDCCAVAVTFSNTATAARAIFKNQIKTVDFQTVRWQYGGSIIRGWGIAQPKMKLSLRPLRTIFTLLLWSFW